MKNTNITSVVLRKWFRIIHRHLSYVMTGMIMVYGISGIIMNHITSWGSEAINWPFITRLADLHYNPGILWTYFSDFFVISLVAIVITGLFMMKGKKGLKGIGGFELLIGSLIPVIILYLSV